MDIERRSLLRATFWLALSELPGPVGLSTLPETDETPPVPAWHPLTRSLLDRARKASSAEGRADSSRVERVIHDTAFAQGCTKSAVIKWLNDPFSAFDYLSRYRLDALLRMDSAGLWRRAGPLSPSTTSARVAPIILASMITQSSFKRP